MEDEALAEIKRLSGDARHYLQHKLRNGLQSILSCIEEGAPEEASTGVLSMSEELRKMGL